MASNDARPSLADLWLSGPCLLRNRYWVSKTNSVRIRRVSDSDSDPDWIRIQSGQWIRIRILNPGPDPGGQK
jgi:hypothetical protein